MARSAGRVKAIGRTAAKSTSRPKTPIPASDVPTGAIFPFLGNENMLPAGYYFCDGAVITSTDDPNLFAVLSNAVPTSVIDASHCHLPDLRGEFVRGWDNGRGVDKGRILGSFQTDAFATHTHQLQRTDAGPQGNSTYPNWNYMGPTNDKGAVAAITPAGTAAETRPRNIAVNYIIKR